MYILTSATTSIVDEDTFPADDKLADDDIENMIGSGPYKLSQYKAGEQAVFEANPRPTTGTKTPQSDAGLRAVLQRPGAAQDGRRERPGRHRLAHAQPDRPQQHRGGRQGRGHPRQGLGVPLLGLAVLQRRRQEQGDPPGRRADHRPPGDLRQRLRRHRHAVVLHRAARLRWPEGLLPGEVRRAQRRRGQADPRRRRACKTPVKITLGYPPEHYGPNAVDEATELADQLNSSGLFDVNDRGRGVGGVPDALQGGRLRPVPPTAGTPTSWTPTTTCRRSSGTVASSRTTTPAKRSTSSSTRRSARPTRPLATSRSASCRTSWPRTSR